MLNSSAVYENETTQSALRAIRSIESEYHEEQRQAAEDLKRKSADATAELRFGVQREINEKLPQLAPFAQINELTVDNGEVPIRAAVSVLIPEHAPLTIWLSRHYISRKWSVGSFGRGEGNYTQVALSVWNGSCYPREFNTTASLPEALALASGNYPEWERRQAKWQKEQEAESVEYNSSTAPSNEVFHVSDRERALIVALRALLAEDTNAMEA